MPFRPGDRIRIRAVKEVGSARLLDGLTGRVIGPHPIANNWCKIWLDVNHITPDSEWSAPCDRLVLEHGAFETQTVDSGALSEQIKDGHWP